MLNLTQKPHPATTGRNVLQAALLTAALLLPTTMTQAAVAETPLDNQRTTQSLGPRLVEKSPSGHTYSMPEDYLQVTVAPSAKTPQANPLDSDLSIWVGEVTLKNRNALWVELIDEHGEVVYNAEVQPNETHLLPDGRAIAITQVQPAKVPGLKPAATPRKDQSRLPGDSQFVVTQKEAFSPSGDRSIKLLEVQTAPKPSDNSFMIRAGENGELLWKATRDAAVWLRSKS